jgi:hypothetical protein
MRVRTPPGCTSVTPTGEPGGLELVAQRFGKAAHRELAGAIRRLPGRRDDAEDAGDVHQLRRRLGRQQGQEGARQPHRGAEVHGHQRVEVLGLDVLEAPAERDAGVVDEHRQPPVGGPHGGGKVGGGRVVGEVQRMRAGLDPVRAHPRGGGLEAAGVDVHQRQTAAAPGQRVGQRRTDAAGGAGDQCHGTAQRQRADIGHRGLQG